MSHDNNFDLIRLAAAMQVAVVHALTHLNLGSSLAFDLLFAFPGVPVFFFVSGFLVSASYDRSPSLWAYARARALRLFPALWAVTALSILSVALTGYFATVAMDWRVFALWVLGQATVVQFFNPDVLRGYGVGVLNGSLWTLAVEIQLYVLLPLLALLLARVRRAAVPAAALAVLAGAASAAVSAGPHAATFAGKLLWVSALPWLWMFLLGLLAQRHWPRLRPFVEGRFLWWLALYAAAVAGAVLLRERLGVLGHGNKSSVLLFWPLAGLVLSAAFTQPGLARRLLRGHDLSYGLYLVHMPVLNLFLHSGLQPGYGGMAACLTISLGLAAASWRFLERPILRRKRAGPDGAPGRAAPLPDAAPAR
jgi:peptidoglycan/LPS O-acetylase OafA/YrhL